MTEITVRLMVESEWWVYRASACVPWQSLPVRLPRPWPRKLIVTSSSGVAG
jgi:hypothetical protein